MKEYDKLLIIAIVIKFSCANRILLHQTEGSVPRENFTYYSLNYPGNIILVLNTVQGDADIYVSENLQRPGFEPEKYDLHSATCGRDVIHVPRSFSRPIGVAVYGHSSHDISNYTLEVYFSRNSNEATIYENLEAKPQNSQNPNSKEKRQTAKKYSKLKTFLGKSGLWALLEIFELVFL